MSGALPLVVDLAQAARQGARIRGSLSIESLPRLRAALASGDGQAHVDLRVEVDGGRRVVRGSIDAKVQAICQRCLEPVTLTLHAEPRLAWVTSEDEAVALPDEYEPILASDGRVATADLVTDELLLALPLAPAHEDVSDCGNLAEAMAEQRAVPDEVRKSPFEQLAALKRSR